MGKVIELKPAYESLIIQVDNPMQYGYQFFSDLVTAGKFKVKFAVTKTSLKAYGCDILLFIRSLQHNNIHYSIVNQL